MKTGFIKIDYKHKDIVYQITDTGCHEIISHCSSGSSGYHRMKIDGKSIDIHRWIYTKHTGLDLTGLLVRHKCDNRHCINIDHLEHGTYQDNVNDMIERGRQYSKLTETDVLEILELHKQGFNQKDIANQFNISRENISSILCGDSWVRVTGISYDKRVNSCNEKYIYNDNCGKWRVAVWKQNKRIYLGRFSELKDAIAARDNYLKSI